jgi:hypothetical protein
MALAKKCDRCGGYFDHYHTDKSDVNGLVEVDFNSISDNYKAIVGIDLCPKCVRAYKYWKEHPETDIIK